MHMPRHVIVVPQECDIESTANVIQQILPYGSFYGHVSFNMQDLRFIYPSGIVVLASLIAWLSQECRCHVEVVPPHSSDVQRYLCRMDFYQELGIELLEDFRRYDATGRFQEMIWLRDESNIDEVAASLTKIILADADMNESLKISLQYSIAEIGSNIFHHARSPIGGFLCAQKYPRQRIVEVAIADCGIGVRGAMSQRYTEFHSPESAGAALLKAIQRNITSRPENNTGQGLFFTTEVIRANGGQASIQSEHVMLVVTPQANTIRSRPSWQGTVVCLQFQLDSEADLVALFNRYYPPEDDYGLNGGLLFEVP